MYNLFNFKVFSFLLLSVFVFNACESFQGTLIQGEIKGGENLTVYLDEVAISRQGNILLQEKLDANGQFTIKVPEGIKKGLYRLRLGEQVVDLIMEGTEKEVNIKGNLSELNEFRYTIEGSPLSAELQTKVREFADRVIDQSALTAYTTDTADPLVASIIGARIFGFRPEFTDFHKEISARLTEAYPEMSVTTEYASIVNQIDQQMKAQMAAAKIKLGEEAPEIALPDPDGKIRKLSDYRGKVVLIDFWASWCGPCRKANPKVVEVYKKYKSQGFDVFSVSLDGIDSRTAQRYPDQATINEQMKVQKQRWLDAIAQDQLEWRGHVSDLKKWECAPAQEYGVRSIPQTFLVNRDGKILAINPRLDLEEQVVKNL